LTSDQVDELIYILEGTSDSLESGLDQLDLAPEDMTQEDCGRLDDAIFRCDECGWWVETSQASSMVGYGGEPVCLECHPEED